MADIKKKLLLGITGATGMLYVPSLLNRLAAEDCEVHGIVSDAGCKVLRVELGLHPETLPHVSKWFSEHDFTAAPASGSARYDGMIVLPCTMGSMAAIAAGYCGNLIHRAADVTLKEKRPLLLAVRETPLNRTHLTNMLALHDAGAIICPPMPSFYNQPENFEEMADYYTARLCDQLGFRVKGIKRWQEG